MARFTIDRFYVSTKNIAKAMTEQTPCYITPDMVKKVGKNPQMCIYAAQTGDVTILCWAHMDGRFSVKYVCW